MRDGIKLNLVNEATIYLLAQFYFNIIPQNVPYSVVPYQIRLIHVCIAGGIRFPES
jgi:hypothetical protein